MDERDAKRQKIEVHRREMTFVRGYVSCNNCACNYDQNNEPTFCQTYSMPMDPQPSEANTLRGEACDQWVGRGMDRNKVVTPEHHYRYDKWMD